MGFTSSSYEGATFMPPDQQKYPDGSTVQTTKEFLQFLRLGCTAFNWGAAMNVPSISRFEKLSRVFFKFCESAPSMDAENHRWNSAF
jgi:hypothetical protein